MPLQTQDWRDRTPLDHCQLRSATQDARRVRQRTERPDWEQAYLAGCQLRSILRCDRTDRSGESRDRWLRIVREITVSLSPFAPRKQRCFRGAKGDTNSSNDPKRSSRVYAAIDSAESPVPWKAKTTGEGLPRLWETTTRNERFTSPTVSVSKDTSAASW